MPWEFRDLPSRNSNLLGLQVVLGKGGELALACPAVSSRSRPSVSHASTTPKSNVMPIHENVTPRDNLSKRDIQLAGIDSPNQKASLK